MDCELCEFIERHKKLTYKPGCAFYEFKNDKEDISERKEVLLMDKVCLNLVIDAVATIITMY